MIRKILILATIILVSCSQKSKNSVIVSPIILKNGSFIDLKLEVFPISRSEINIQLLVVNKSNDSFQLYKPLFPYNDTIGENTFIIYDDSTKREIKFTGSPVENYLKLIESPESLEVVVPSMDNDNFITILPKQEVAFRANLANAYGFDDVAVRAKSRYSISPFFIVPLVDKQFRHVHEVDSIEMKSKPVYYILGLPETISAARRLKFEVD